MKSVGILLLAIAIGIALWAIPERAPLDDPEPGVPPAQPLEVQAAVAEAWPENGRTPILKDSLGSEIIVVEIDHELMHQLVADCLKTDDPISCMVFNRDLVLSTDLFSTLVASASSPEEASMIASVFLLKSDPKDVLKEYSALYKQARKLNSMVDDMVLEGGFRLACQRDRAWQFEVAAQVSSSTIFGPELTDIGVIMAGTLAANDIPAMRKVLRSGLQEDSIATKEQKVRALGWIASTSENAFTQHVELTEILSSLSPDADPEVPSTIGLFLISPSSFPGGDPQLNLQIVDRIASNPKWGPYFARLIAGNGGRPHAISEDQWEPIRISLESWE
jgi:hypothetical protein